MVTTASTASTAALVTESTIRKMTRLAQEHQAINLSQGFPNEGPPAAVRLALAYSVLTGRVPLPPPPPPPSSSSSYNNEITHNNYYSTVMAERLAQILLQQYTPNCRSGGGDSTDDVTNQYSPPMGRPDVRAAVAAYYHRLYNYTEAHSDNITITLGATEAIATALRTIGAPGDKVVILEPFHELYPHQCQMFYLEPVFVTLREDRATQEWSYDRDELKQALSNDAKVLILNSPHNPTGKVFTATELTEICHWCMEFDVYIITDEIYEHMIEPPPSARSSSDAHDGGHADKDATSLVQDEPQQPCRRQHHLLPQLVPQIRDRVLLCNSIGKSASATGWRLGWCLTPSHLTESYRGLHDQMVVMAPHPVQVAALTYLALPTPFFQHELPCRYTARIHKLALALRDFGFVVSIPHGAYYLFADYTQVPQLGLLSTTNTSSGGNAMQAAMYMIETVGVACVPGDTFYHKNSTTNNGDDKDGSRYLRFAACRSEADVEEACLRLAKHRQS